MDFIDGVIVLEENPCATFEAVTQAGYTLRYRLDQSTGAFVDLLVRGACRLGGVHGRRQLCALPECGSRSPASKDETGNSDVRVRREVVREATVELLGRTAPVRSGNETLVTVEPAIRSPQAVGHSGNRSINRLPAPWMFIASNVPP